MIRKIGRFEELNADGRPIRVENDARIPELGPPSLLEQATAHCSVNPTPRQIFELVMVRATWRQRAVHRKTANTPQWYLCCLRRLVCAHEVGLDLII